jgi:RNA polymerase sigma-70 factor (ECF subfamily)
MVQETAERENEVAATALEASRTDESDASLAGRVVAGDAQAFEHIMRRHNRMLYRIARSILRDDTEAEDCLQSAYLLAYRSMPAFAGRAKLSTWLVRIVINEALGRKRRTARQGVIVSFDGARQLSDPSHAPDVLSTEEPGPEREAMRQELRELIEQRIDALPEAFRGVFVLRAVEELSVQDTAELLDIPAATVRTRFFRARSMLRESLAREVDVAIDEAFAFDGARCDRIVATVLARISGPSPPPPAA